MERPFLLYAAMVAPMLPIGVGLRKIKYLKSGMKVLLFFFILDELLTAISYWLATYKSNNLWIIHADTILRLGAFGIAYSIWQTSRRARLVTGTLLGMFFVYWLWTTGYTSSLTQFENYSKSISKLLLAGLSCYMLYVLANEENVDLFLLDRFWIVSGTVVYATGTLFLAAFGSTILGFNNETFLKVWAVNWMLFIIANIVYTGGFLCSRPGNSS